MVRKFFLIEIKKVTKNIIILTFPFCSEPGLEEGVSGKVSVVKKPLCF